MDPARRPDLDDPLLELAQLEMRELALEQSTERLKEREAASPTQTISEQISELERRLSSMRERMRELRAQVGISPHTRDG
jgi:hypothetical protein